MKSGLKPGQVWQHDNGTRYCILEVCGRGRNRAAFCKITNHPTNSDMSAWVRYKNVTCGKLVQEKAKR